jgi:hypothetical protein
MVPDIVTWPTTVCREHNKMSAGQMFFRKFTVIDFYRSLQNYSEPLYEYFEVYREGE